MPAPRAIEFRYGDPTAAIGLASELGTSRRRQEERERQAMRDHENLMRARELRTQEKMQRERIKAGERAAAQQQQRQNQAASGSGFSTVRRPLDQALQKERGRSPQQPIQQSQGVPVPQGGRGYGAIRDERGTTAVNGQNDQVVSLGNDMGLQEVQQLLAAQGGEQVSAGNAAAIQGVQGGGPGVTQFTPTPMLPPEAVQGLKVLEQFAPQLDEETVQGLAAAIQTGGMDANDVVNQIEDGIKRKLTAQKAAQGDPSAQKEQRKLQIADLEQQIDRFDRQLGSHYAQLGEVDTNDPVAQYYQSQIDEREAAVRELERADTGSTKLDRTTALEFLRQAGGNKARARELAKAAGYSL